MALDLDFGVTGDGTVASRRNPPSVLRRFLAGLVLAALVAGGLACDEETRCPRGSRSIDGRCRIVTDGVVGEEAFEWPPADTIHTEPEEEPRPLQPGRDDAVSHDAGDVEEHTGDAIPDDGRDARTGGDSDHPGDTTASAAPPDGSKAGV